MFRQGVSHSSVAPARRTADDAAAAGGAPGGLESAPGRMRHFAGRAQRAAHASPPVIAARSLPGAGTVLVTARGYALYMFGSGRSAGR